MKVLRVICLLLFTQLSIHAQAIKKSEEKFIKVRTYSAGKATDNSTLSFYTSDPLQLENIVIPPNTPFSANVRFIDGRVFMKVSRLKIGADIYTVDWRIVGADYNEGVPVTVKNKSIEVGDGDYFTFKVFSN